MSSPSPTTLSEAESRSQSITDAINRIQNPRSRSRAQTTAYLLGATQQLPDFTQEEINQQRAIQTCYAAMAGEVLPQPMSFRIPMNTTKADTLTTYVEVPFAPTDIRRDIFERIVTYMGVPQNYENLAWRLSTARQTDPPHRLLTSEDLDSAFKAVKDASGRKKKPVCVEILNMAPATIDKQAKRKRGESDAGDASCGPTMIPYTKAYEHLKGRLRCSTHPGEHKWCWIDPTKNNAPHVPLSVQDLQEWAKYLHDENTPPKDWDVLVPPNTLRFDELRISRKERSVSSIPKTSGDPSSTIIHNHIHLSGTEPLEELRMSRTPTASPATSRQYAMYLDSEDGSDVGEAPPLGQFIEAINDRYPGINFSQYEDRLHKHGIVYLETAARFPSSYYETKLDMPPGIAVLFHDLVQKEQKKVDRAKLKRKEKGKKKMRMLFDDEDGNQNAQAGPSTSF
ncbi:hypothetical protein BJ138DRAFT_1108042 [Hygrophoropsis aurantiaca]|uniref:Uncharacterized protein n=1 Tax=Hygrophoropsis aurantiaca TaxID=72124 RepID=A0ACB7ZPA4_9AGAM|nr:hypothetical protein BJ138DRAFT_1108042 [Hygrophoropsis aurantiaca]